MKKFINICWSQDPLERPSFDSIFEELSNYITYSTEKVDQVEIDNYIKRLNESRKESFNKFQAQKVEEERESIQKELEDIKSENKNLLEQINELKKKCKNLENQMKSSRKCLHIKVCEAKKLIKTNLIEKPNH